MLRHTNSLALWIVDSLALQTPASPAPPHLSDSSGSEPRYHGFPKWQPLNERRREGEREGGGRWIRKQETEKTDFRRKWVWETLNYKKGQCSVLCPIMKDVEVWKDWTGVSLVQITKYVKTSLPIKATQICSCSHIVYVDCILSDCIEMRSEM